MSLVTRSGPAYRIETPRLVIRCWNPVDAPLLHAGVAESLDHLRPWMPWAAQESETVEDKVDRLRTFRGQFDLGQDFVYGIFDVAETRVLGGTGLHLRVGPRAREIGYWIHAQHAGKGLATEAAGALTRVAFEIDRVERVEIHCAPDNGRSAKVAKNLGFTQEAVLRRRAPTPAGRARDTLIFTLFAEEFPATPAARACLVAYDAVGSVLLKSDGAPTPRPEHGA